MNVASAVTGVQLFLADGGNSPADVDPTTGHGPEWGKAGPMGLFTIVVLCVAVYFLVKSMNRNLKKVPESFDAAPKVSVGANGVASGADNGTAGPVDAAPTAGSSPAVDASAEVAPPIGRATE